MKKALKLSDNELKQVFDTTYQILVPERSFYFAAIIYGIGVGILTLAIPISVQALVNTISFGVLTQPLIVLSIILLVLLILSSFLKTLQIYIIELFQRKIYARLTTMISDRMLEADPSYVKFTNTLELINRYFDIFTIQKGVKELIMDALGMFLQIFVGLLLLAFYHPYFLIFDFLLILLIWFVWWFYGKNAISTALEESTAKYKVAHWLEEVARENFFFKSIKRQYYAAAKTDSKVLNYLEARKLHFRYLFSQHIFLMVIYALMSTLILGLGGFLVINGQLSLGQLVASELIITLMLASLAKSGKYLESFYDLIAAIMKINSLLVIPKEKLHVENIQNIENGELKFEAVTYETSSFKFSFDLDFKSGRKYLVNYKYHTTKNIFLDLIRGILSPKTGKLKLGGINYSSMSQQDIRDSIYIVEEPTLFHGTIRDNLTICLGQVSEQEIIEALDIVDLTSIIEKFDDGLETKILMSGFPLWKSQLLRLDIARAIIMRPKILILTGAIDLIDEYRLKKILDYFAKISSTVIVFSHLDIFDEQYEKTNLELINEI